MPKSHSIADRQIDLSLKKSKRSHAKISTLTLTRRAHTHSPRPTKPSQPLNQDVAAAAQHPEEQPEQSGVQTPHPAKPDMAVTKPGPSNTKRRPEERIRTETSDTLGLPEADWTRLTPSQKCKIRKKQHRQQRSSKIAMQADDP